MATRNLLQPWDEEAFSPMAIPENWPEESATWLSLHITPPQAGKYSTRRVMAMDISLISMDSGYMWQGQPLDRVGAHCLDNNSDSIGICFEGNMQKENLTDEQLKSGKILVRWLLSKYKLKAKTSVFGHRDLMATACPGNNFPLSTFKKLTKKGCKITKIRESK